jgi:hypothetical protein
MHVDRWRLVYPVHVVTVWFDGARLKVGCPIPSAEFFLLFTSSGSPVYRRCKKVWTRSNEIEVEYQRKEPGFDRQMNAIQDTRWHRSDACNW